MKENKGELLYMAYVLWLLDHFGVYAHQSILVPDITVMLFLVLIQSFEIPMLKCSFNKDLARFEFMEAILVI